MCWRRQVPLKQHGVTSEITYVKILSVGYARARARVCVCVCVWTRETQELVVKQRIMHNEGLDDFCRTLKIFTVIESVPGLESTRN